MTYENRGIGRQKSNIKYLISNIKFQMGKANPAVLGFITGLFLCLLLFGTFYLYTQGTVTITAKSCNQAPSTCVDANKKDRLYVTAESSLNSDDAQIQITNADLRMVKKNTATSSTQYPSRDVQLQCSGWNTTTVAESTANMTLRAIAGSGATGSVPYRLGVLNTGGTEFASFDGLNQRVGIGQTSPSQKLDVAGAMILEPIAAPTCGASAKGAQYFDSTANKMYYCNGTSWMDMTGGGGGSSLWTNSGTTDYLTTTTDSVAIGGTSASYKLDVTGTARATTALVSPVLKPASDSTTALQLQTSAGTNVLNVDTTNSRVGIGTTSPGAALDVLGNILINGNGSIDTRAAGTLTLGGTTQTGLTLGRAGQSTTLAGNVQSFTMGTSNNITFASGGSVTSVNGSIALEAGGTGTGSTGSGSIYFTDNSGTVKARMGTSSDTVLVGSTGTGGDGAINITGSSNCQTTALASGRSSADCVATSISTTSNAGQTTVTVTSSAGFSSNSGNFITSGDEVLLIQMTGTGAGNYEFQRVASTTATTLVVNKNLTNTYTNDVSSKAQAIRVPNYTTVTVGASGILTVSAWNGTTGGVLAFRASGTVTVASGGIIDANGLGLSGGSGGSAGSSGAGYAGIANGSAGTAGSAGGTGSGTGGGNGGTATGNNGGGDTGCSGGQYGGGGGGGSGGGGAGGSYAATANNGSAGGAGGAGGSGCSTGGVAGSAGGAGVAGSTYGTANLSSLYLGSGGGGGAGGGGGGGGGSNYAPCTAGSGGNGGSGGAGSAGGGIIYIEASTLSNGGTIRANGAAGSTGSSGSNGTVGGSCGFFGYDGGGGGGAGGGGGGGGSGGSIYLAAGSVTPGTITATGGAAGTGGSNGGNGEPGYSGGGGGGGSGVTAGSSGGSGAVAGSSVANSAGAGGSGRIRCDSTSGTDCNTGPNPAANQNVYNASIPNTFTASNYSTLYIGRVNASQADLAENYVVGDPTIGPGDVVSLAPDVATPPHLAKNQGCCGDIMPQQGIIVKASKPYDIRLMGIISTIPGFTLGNPDSANLRDYRALSLAGRVPVKIDPDSPAIEPGDFLTASPKPGLAMKAVKAGYVVAKALNGWTPGPTAPAMIPAFIHLGYYTPTLPDKDAIANQAPIGTSDSGSALSHRMDVVEDLWNSIMEKPTNQPTNQQVEELSRTVSGLTQENRSLRAKEKQLEERVDRLGKTVEALREKSER